MTGEKVERGDQIEGALERGIKVTRDGKPYVVEVDIARYGGGKDSTWHQRFNLAEQRKRKAYPQAGCCKGPRGVFEGGLVI